jgi:hypothetical protein
MTRKSLGRFVLEGGLREIDQQAMVTPNPVNKNIGDFASIDASATGCAYLVQSGRF